MTVEKWSPELISVVGNKRGKCPVSAELLYQRIWRCKHENKRADNVYKRIYELLKHGKRRRKRGHRKDSRDVIQNRFHIEQRPDIVDKRLRAGDI